MSTVVYIFFQYEVGRQSERNKITSHPFYISNASLYLISPGKKNNETAEEKKQETAEKNSDEKEEMEETTGEAKEDNDAKPTKLEKPMKTSTGRLRMAKSKLTLKEQAEEKRLSEMMIPKKIKPLYYSLKRAENKELERMKQLKKKRMKIDIKAHNRRISELQEMKKARKKSKAVAKSS